jgi:hypothetical protein
MQFTKNTCILTSHLFKEGADFHGIYVNSYLAQGDTIPARRTLRVGRRMGRPKIGRSPRRTIKIRRPKFTAVRDLHFAPCFSET